MDSSCRTSVESGSKEALSFFILEIACSANLQVRLIVGEAKASHYMSRTLILIRVYFLKFFYL